VLSGNDSRGFPANEGLVRNEITLRINNLASSTRPTLAEADSSKISFPSETSSVVDIFEDTVSEETEKHAVVLVFVSSELDKAGVPFPQAVLPRVKWRCGRCALDFFLIDDLEGRTVSAGLINTSDW